MFGLIKKDIKLVISNKTLIVFCGILLCVVALFLGKSLSNEKTSTDDNDKIMVGIVNEDIDNKYSKMLIEFFCLDDQFSEMVEFKEIDTVENMEDKFMNKEVDAYIIIPKGFIENLIRISDTKIVVRIAEENTTAVVLLKNVLKSYEAYISAVQCNTDGLYMAMKDADIPTQKAMLENEKLSYSLVGQVMNKSESFKYEYVKTDEFVTTSDYYIYAGIVVFIMYIALYIGIEILKEKGYGVLNRYKACGGSCLKFIISKLSCSVFFIGIVVESVYVFVCKIRKRDINIEVMFFLLVIMIFYLMFSICASLVINKLHTYVLTINMISILSIMLGGAIIPVNYMPENMKSIAEYIPTYNFIDILTLLNTGRELGDSVVFVISIILVSIGMLILSSRFCNRSASRWI